jgi:hypothetical protein
LAAAALLLLWLPPADLWAKMPQSWRYSEDGTQLLQDGLDTGKLYDPTVVREFGLAFSPPDWWEQLTANYASGTEIAADLTVDGDSYPGVGVRFKGMTSYRATGTSRKKSFNISLDFQDPAQRLMGYRTLNLNNASSDPSFVREALYFATARHYMPCPKVAFVHLTINGEDWGVYVHVQQPNTDLIDEWFADTDGSRWKVPFAGGGQGGPGGPGTTGPDSLFPGGTDSLGQGTPPGGPPTLDGWLASPQARDLNGDARTDAADFALALQAGGPPPGGTGPGGNTGPGGQFQLLGDGKGALAWLGPDSTAYTTAYVLESTHVDSPWVPLLRACDLVNNVPVADLGDSLDAALDLDRWLWFLAVENLFADEDSYLTKGADYQIYAEPGSGRLHPLEYDGNEAFTQRDTALSPFEGESSTQRPMLNRALASPKIRQRFLAHVRTLLAEALDWAVLGPRVTAYQSQIDSLVQADPKKLGTYAQFDSSAEELHRFVTARRAYLLARPDVAAAAPQISAVDLGGATASGKISVTRPAGQAVPVVVTVAGSTPAAAVTAWYADGLEGRFAAVALHDDGRHADGTAGDGRFGGLLPAAPAGTVVRYYAEASAADGTVSLAPPGAEHNTWVYQTTADLAATTPVVINEVMAVNTATATDPQGEYEDWIELHSVVGDTVDLSGMYLSDSTDDLRKWAFPAGSVIAPHGYLVVWADDDGTAAGGLHTNFHLSAGGEWVVLSDADPRGNAILDSLSFGEQLPDQSLGRSPDGQGPFARLAEATPGAANAAPTAVLEGTWAAPGGLALAANYPNPFNGGTTLCFTLPEAGATRELTVYNLAGQRLVHLDLSQWSAGTHQWRWDGRDMAGVELASGVYVCRLTDGRQAVTRRLVLAR